MPTATKEPFTALPSRIVMRLGTSSDLLVIQSHRSIPDEVLDWMKVYADMLYEASLPYGVRLIEMGPYTNLQEGASEREERDRRRKRQGPPRPSVIPEPSWAEPDVKLGWRFWEWPWRWSR